MATSNKRRHPRIRARGISSHLRAAGSASLAMPVENISIGGMFVRCQDPLPAGSPLSLELVRPGWRRTLRLTGRVVASLPVPDASARGLIPGMGVRFDALETEVLARLQELLEALTRGEPSPPEHHPTLIDPEMASARAASFDFGFVSLDDLPHGPPAGEAPESQWQHGPPRVAAPPRPGGAHGARPMPATVPPKLFPVAPAPSPPRAARAEGGRAPPPVLVPEGAKLQVQVRGLMLELTELQARLEVRDKEIEGLRAERLRLREGLARRDARIAELEAQVRRGAPRP